jgi:ubiquinone/menaquinone biosynthesis C-methylase UbiE
MGLAERDVWDDLFDDLYLEMYASRMAERDPVAEARAAVELAGIRPGAAVLDAPCGFGRHSIALARDGYSVTGVDRSRVQLDEARKQAEGDENPRWLQADVRELPLGDESFDAVLNLFSSLGYRGEDGDRSTLREFLRVLRPGGAVVIETMHRDRLVRIFDPQSWEELEDGSLLFEERAPDYLAGELETRIELVRADGSRRGVTYRLRCYTATELAALLRDAGFSHVEAYGGYEGAELTPERRLVLVARR